MAVIFAYKTSQQNVGKAHSGLGITAFHTAEVLNELDFGVEPWGVFDGYDLVNRLKEREKRSEDITHIVMLAPWVDTAWLERTVMAFPQIRWSVCYHSNVGFLQADAYAVKLLREQIRLERNVENFNIAGNCKKLVNAVNQGLRAPCQHLPNLYAPNLDHWEPRRYTGGVLRMGIFSATRQLKNILTAAWAAVIVAQRLQAESEVWISSGRNEGDGGVLRAVRELFQDLPHIKLVENGWQTWSRFRETVRHMHLMFQPSFTESHNNVVTDGIVEGVPSAVSPAIDWVPYDWQANPDDACDLANTAIHLLQDRKAPARGLKALQNFNADGVRIWQEYLFDPIR
jgi:hypothetical protein